MPPRGQEDRPTLDERKRYSERMRQVGVGMVIDRELMREALRDLVHRRTNVSDRVGFGPRPYRAALEEWAGRLDVEAHMLHKLVLVKEALPVNRLHS